MEIVQKPKVDKLEQLHALQGFENKPREAMGLLSIHSYLLADDDIGVVTIGKIMTEWRTKLL